jgi:excisionase family DNA binding protein
MTTLEEARLLTAKEAADFLRISIGTLYHWVSERRIEPIRFSSRCIRFRLGDLISWVHEQRRTLR